MGSTTVSAAARARREEATAHDAPPSRCAPRSHRPPPSSRSWSTPPLRHVEDVAAPQPERTRRLPLHQLVERERHPLGLPVLLLTEPDHLVLRELGAPARERDRLHDASSGRAAGTRPGCVTSPSTNTRGPLISRTSTATAASWMYGSSAFVRPCLELRRRLPGGVDLARERERDLARPGRTGTTRVSSGSCQTTTSSTSSRPIRYSPALGARLRRSEAPEDAHAAGEEHAGHHCPVRGHHPVPPGTHVVPQLDEPPSTARATRCVPPCARPVRRDARPARSERAPDAARTRASGSPAVTARRRGGRTVFPRVGNGGARVAAAAPAHDVPSGRERGPSGAGAADAGGAMLRATAWTVGLFGAGTAIARMFPGTWTEPLVLLALGLAFLFVSRAHRAPTRPPARRRARGPKAARAGARSRAAPVAHPRSPVGSPSRGERGPRPSGAEARGAPSLTRSSPRRADRRSRSP